MRKDSEACLPKNTVPRVKVSGGSIMIWGCFSAKSVINISVIDDKMNAQKYKQILQETLMSSVDSLELPSDYIFQQNNDPKHTAKSTKKSSSSSCRATSTDIPDPLSPLHPIVHHFWQVLRATPQILTELLYVGSS